MIRMRFFCLFSLTFLLVIPKIFPENSDSICWPLHLFGITAGVNNESEVIRLLGEGIEDKNLGDTGGRIFTDKNHRTTLLVSFATDKVVDKIVFLTGTEKLAPRDLKRAESRFINPDIGFGKWFQLKLGSSEQDILTNLGNPNTKEEDGGWVYNSTCSCGIQEFLKINFKNSRISKLTLASPAG